MDAMLRIFSRQPILLTAALAIAPTAWAATDPITAAVEQAAQNGDASVTIAPGTYTLAPDGSSHLRWRNLHDLHIVMDGVTVVCTDPSVSALVLDNAENVTIEGLTLDYDPLPFTQGAIVDIVDNRRLKVRIDEGYPTDASYFTSGLAVYLYEPDGSRIKQASPDLYPTAVTADATDPQVLWFDHSFDLPIADGRVAIGDPIALTRRIAGAVRINNTSGVTFEDVTIHAGAGIGIQEASGDGDNVYRGVRIMPGPAPETPSGPGVPRLVSTCADGIHSSYMHHGPLVEGCEFAAMGDDAVAIHGTYAVVIEYDSPRSCIVSPKYSLPLKVGDTLRVLASDDQRIKGEPTVTAIQQVDMDDLRSEPEDVVALWAPYGIDAFSRPYYRITFGTVLSTSGGDLAISPDRVGAGFRVVNNTVHPHRARAFMIKSTDGIIEDNVVTGSSHGGIAIGPEFSIWLGGVAGDSLIVRNNTFAETGYHGSALLAPSNPITAAISIHAGRLDKTWSPTRLNHNIVIEHNTIDTPAGQALLVACADGVTISDNTFIFGDSLRGVTGTSAFGVNANADLWFDRCDNVTLSGNTYIGRAPMAGRRSDTQVDDLDGVFYKTRRVRDVAPMPFDGFIITPGNANQRPSTDPR